MTLNRPKCGCGIKVYASQWHAEKALTKVRDLGLRKKAPCTVQRCGQGQWHLVGSKNVNTGPDRSTKELVMERDDWTCAACGKPVSGLEYSRQHRVARGKGGTSVRWKNSPANLVLVCGSANTPNSCHLLCEQRDPGMYDRGFWLHREEDARKVPVEHALFGRVLLDMDGGWSPTPVPGGVR